MNLSPEKRIAGVLVPLFALRGEDDLGIGDIGALREFIDWVAGSWIQARPTPADQRDRSRQQPLQRDQRDGDRADHAAARARLAGGLNARRL